MFKNAPFTDFSLEENRQKYQEALARLETEIKNSLLVSGPIIDGRSRETSRVIHSEDPANKGLMIGKVFLADRNDANDAVSSLEKGFMAWADETSYQERARIIAACGARMEDERFYLSALLTREAGKNWREADADVAEAIDFCNFYADEMLRLGKPYKTMEIAGEDNYYFYQPRGVSVVIAPWNFPLAIACGMAVAALVTGSPAILKPSEQTSIIAAKLAHILLECGVPKDVFALLPGVGEEVGRQLVEDPRVAMICFTGSKQVGLEIIRKASEVKEGQSGVKRVVAEMGGKNAIIVDEDADLEEAVKGVLQSAFGFSGQKCSACSRVIVVGDGYQEFVKKLADASRDISIGKPEDPATFMGPVIDAESRARIMKVIEEGEQSASGELVFKGEIPSDGHYVPPTIFKDVQVDSPLWTKEIFGPVLAIRKAASFEEALQLANNSEYALTGGVFSRNPSNLKKAQIKFKVGNLYINRTITGAIVCRQPFGGFKMSGIGSKAGGHDYLLQFMEPRVVTENTMRKGFTPELS
jgi:RHH-type proline utilization regulon transcriptional repressor/proline dehydrogenase/delta 1-pyrroline-5-carboxylate dehydrogenase